MRPYKEGVGFCGRNNSHNETPKLMREGAPFKERLAYNARKRLDGLAEPKKIDYYLLSCILSCIHFTYLIRLT